MAAAWALRNMNRSPSTLSAVNSVRSVSAD
jgi:hypothetical protein